MSNPQLSDDIKLALSTVSKALGCDIDEVMNGRRGRYIKGRTQARAVIAFALAGFGGKPSFNWYVDLGWAKNEKSSFKIMLAARGKKWNECDAFFQACLALNRDPDLVKMEILKDYPRQRKLKEPVVLSQGIPPLQARAADRAKALNKAGMDTGTIVDFLARELDFHTGQKWVAEVVT